MAAGFWGTCCAAILGSDLEFSLGSNLGFSLGSDLEFSLGSDLEFSLGSDLESILGLSILGTRGSMRAPASFGRGCNLGSLASWCGFG